MKDFRKTKNGHFICEECNKTYIKKENLSRHISLEHGTKKIYYDKWIKENDEGCCKICKKETEFTGFKHFYRNCCSKECSEIYTQKCSKESIHEKYGVDNVYQSKEMQHKIKLSKKEKYNNEKYNNSEKQKTTFYSKTTESKNAIKEKRKNTFIEKYGVESPFKIEGVREKIKETWINNYGVEHPNQIREQFEKGLKTRLLIQYYKNTDIIYQGSYELDFLEKYYDKFFDISRGPSIKYNFKGKKKVYYSDFYIPSLNLVIEIKSSWTLKLDAEIDAKKKATISNGFNYILIVNKNYNDFNKFFHY